MAEETGKRGDSVQVGALAKVVDWVVMSVSVANVGPNSSAYF